LAILGGSFGVFCLVNESPLARRAHPEDENLFAVYRVQNAIKIWSFSKEQLPNFNIEHRTFFSNQRIELETL
jgi:hypothetical protein